MCPIKGCDVRRGTCPHLDTFIEYGDKLFRPQPQVLYTEDIDDYQPEVGRGVPAVTGCWEFYKKLKRTGLDNDQISILIRRFHLDMSMKQIMDEMGWTSWSSLYRRYRKALELLQRQPEKLGVKR